MADFTQDLSDSVALPESIAKAISRPISESVSFADSIQRGVGRSVSESLPIAEIFIRRVVASRSFVDSAAIADTISKRDCKRAFIEPKITLTDWISKRGIGKAVSDALNLLDSLWWPSSPRVMDPLDTSVRVMETIVIGD